jgi:hypothetical protein
MSNIGSIGSTAADLLAAIRQQLLAKAGTSGSAQKTAGDDSDAIVGQLDGTGNSSSSTAASNQTTGNSSNGLSSGVLSVLIVLQEQQASGGGGASSQSGSSDPNGGGQQLFAALDSNGDGQVSKSELESAFTGAAGAAGVTTDQATQAADALIGKLDTNGDGAVSQTELAGGGPKGHHHLGSPSDAAGGGDPLASLLQTGSASSADNSTSVTNADGSTTTTITYADGTKITLSTPAAADSTDASSSTGTSAAGNDGSSTAPAQSPAEKLLAALIRLQEQAFQPQAADVASLAA